MARRLLINGSMRLGRVSMASLLAVAAASCEPPPPAAPVYPGAARWHGPPGGSGRAEPPGAGSRSGDASRPGGAGVAAHDLEALLRARLAEPALRDCIAYRGERVFQVQVATSATATTSATAAQARPPLRWLEVRGTTSAEVNCINRLLGSWTVTEGPLPDADLAVVVVDDPDRPALEMRVVRELPGAGAAPPDALEVVGGSLGGAGFRDGPAPEARFAIPLGLAAGPDGVLYVGDAENRAIRRLDPARGEVRTAALVPQREIVPYGNGTREIERQALRQPAALAFDGAGRLHALDTLTGEIWRLDEGGAIRVFDRRGRFGTPAALRGPRSLVFDGDGSAIVADSQNHRIVRVDLADGTVTAIAGQLGEVGHRDGDRALFSYPVGLALDGAGRLYVADWGNHTVREVTLATGRVRTVAGRAGRGGHADGMRGVARLDGPSCVALDGGALYVVESIGLVVRRIDLASGRVTTLAGRYKAAGAADGAGARARFDHHWSSALGELPCGLAVAGEDLYLTDSGNHTVRRIARATGEVTTIAGRALQRGAPRPRALAYGADGALYGTSGQALMRLHPGGDAEQVAGSPTEMGRRDGRGARARFRGPIALGALPDGALVVGEVNGTIRRVDPRTGAVTTLANLERILASLAVGDEGVYVGAHGAILHVAPGGEVSAVVSRDRKEDPEAIAALSLGGVVGLAASGDTLWVLDVHRASSLVGGLVTLRRFNLAARSGEALATWRLPADRVGAPSLRGLAVAADGSLWIAHRAGVVFRFDPRTGAEEAVIAARPGERSVNLDPPASVNAPTMPVVDAAGALLFIDEGAALRLRR